MRKKIVAGNWKMHKTFTEAEDLIFEIDEALNNLPEQKAEVILCIPFPYLELAVDIAMDGKFFVGAQNIHDKDYGAYTGEISATMLRSLDVDYVIIGHSERRTYFHEDDAFLYAKVLSALKNDIYPIFCFGEILSQREAAMHFEIIKSQLENTVFHLSSEEFSKIILAYEPVWAIGTGVNASPEQAQEIHAYVRKLVAEKFGEKIAEDTVILYGGSCNPSNAASLFSQTDVDGGLIGGASLKADDFVKIVNSF
ncbi:MAG: triose-phosphate isomerase [Lentimicrobiaceae bacterium]|nr:triose-phosphate isomerase [Lentimicrobiaceae bacterium]